MSETVRSAPDTVQAAVLRMWTDILPSPPTSPDDDFFDLGGQSLHLVHLLQRVEDAFGVELDVTDLFGDGFSAARTAAEIRRRLAAA